VTEQIAIISDPPVGQAAPERPSRLGLWILATLLGSSYMIGQLVLTVPVLVWLLATKQLSSRQDALDSQPMILTALAAVAVASAATIVLALVWPAVWRAISHQAGLSTADWVGWRPIQVIPWWTIPLITLFVVGGLSAAIALLLHDNGSNLQAKLFETDLSRILASLTVTTVVPVAEELIFRGALFNALMPSGKGLTSWQRNLAPVIITAMVFAVIHRFAGIDTLAGMVQITMLSFYLSGLRAVTGSVKASMVAHFTWNLLGALALSASGMKF
jgi:membrane protease YdiL (CAAX protease family)